MFLHLSKFSRAFCARAEIEHVIATIFQSGGRSEISARAEIHHVIRSLDKEEIFLVVQSMQPGMDSREENRDEQFL